MQYLLTEQEYNNLQSNKKDSINYSNIIWLLNRVNWTHGKEREELINDLTYLEDYPEQTDFVFEKWLKLYPIK